MNTPQHKTLDLFESLSEIFKPTQQPKEFLSHSFEVHQSEKTREGEKYLNASRKKLEGNCGILLRYWQRNNIWLSNKNASLWLDVNNLIQRIPDLKKYGVQIDDREVKSKRSNYKEFRLKCTCKIVGGADVTDKCWVHDTKLRLT